MKETVCVTGGSGGIGQALLERLITLYQVKALFRTKTVISDAWEKRGCIPVFGDIRNDEALSTLVSGAKFVFHCAAIVGQGSYEESYAVNVEATRRLARAAAQNGCRRFVYISSAAVYSATVSDKDFTEDTELSVSDEMAVYALTKLQSERALQEVAQETGLEYTILRPTSVYGPNTKPYTVIPVNLMLKGLPVLMGTGEGILDVVYVEDVVSALLLAADSPQANGEVFNIGHDAVTFNNFHSYYARILNRPARHLPIWIMRVLLQLLQHIPGSRKKATRDVGKGIRFLMKMHENTKRFPATKAKALLGYSPQHSLRAGMLKTEIWLKQSRMIPLTQYSLPNYGPLHFRPFAVAHPSSEEDIVQINETALQSNTKVRAIGSLHSMCPIPETDGICIVLDGYNKLLKVEGSLVTVQAGMTIRELNEILAERGLALPSLGTITQQTVSGAISTATHGGSIYHGSLSDSVEAVRIVRADGTVVEVDRSHELFEALIVSIGLFGVTSTVTFRCVPSFALRSRSSVMKAQQVIEDFDALTRRSLYTCMFYFPVTDDIEILSVDKIESDGIDMSAKAQRNTSSKPKSIFTTIVGQHVASAGLKSFVWFLRRHNSIQRFFTKLSVGSTYQTRTARSDLVLAFSDHLGSSGRSRRMIQDMEIAVPYEQAHIALDVIRKHFLTTQKYPLMPIHIRCSARSDLWLSPAYKRDVCFLEFWQYPRSDTLFKEIHELLEPFHYRFHWGKETKASPDYISRQYEKWSDFLRLRDEWDPKGMFLNHYVESFFTDRRGGRSG